MSDLSVAVLASLNALDHKYYAYDIETYPNIFTLAIENMVNPSGVRLFEISDRKNDVRLLLNTLRWMSDNHLKMVGYNNVGFDYPVIHHLITKLDVNIDGETMAGLLYDKAMSIIKATKDQSFRNIIWPNDQIVSQVDLFKVHHFDNMAKMTSLKMLEFNMRAGSVKDLPYPPGTMLTPDEMDVLCDYNKHDVAQTADFFRHSIPKIAFREKLSNQYRRDMMSDNDMKIGKNYFISQLEDRLGKNICFEHIDGQRVPRQTIREQIVLGDIILPCIQFNSNEFNTVVKWIGSQVIRETKGVFTGIPYLSLKEDGSYGGYKSAPIARRGRRIIMGDVSSRYNITEFMDQVEQAKKIKAKGEEGAIIKNLHCYYKGFRLDFGTGGLHGCSDPKIFNDPSKTRRLADVN